VLNPSLDFGLDDTLSASSLGQFNFQITINCTNQYSYSINPEIVVITANSGLFITEAGVSQTYQGILSKTDVLNAKAQKPVIDTEEYRRLVGGKLSNMGVGRLLKRFRKKAAGVAGPESSGGALVGGALVGGALVGGMRGKKLGKYLK
jgi:hypothetical protein